MFLTPIAIISGLLTGFVRGGRLEAMRGLGLRWAPLIVLGLVLHGIGDQVEGLGGPMMLALGSAVLITALAKNLHLTGMTIVCIGLLLNLTVLVLNGHVPTRVEALVSVGAVEAATDPSTITGIGAAGEIETKETTLAGLGDIVPVPVFNEVVSFGDLIMIAGLFVLSMNLLLSTRPKGLSVDELLGTASSENGLTTEIDLTTGHGAPSSSELAASSGYSADLGLDRDPADLDARQIDLTSAPEVPTTQR